MNARDIIRDVADYELSPLQVAGAALHDLRCAANADEGDTITIGPDGTVGRLQQAVGSTGGPETLLWLVEWEDPPWRNIAHAEPEAVPSVPLYRVVTP